MTKLVVTHEKRKKQPKSKTLAFKAFKSLPKSSQSVWNAPKSVLEAKTSKTPSRTEETM